MSIPFQWPTAYAAAVQPPHEAPERSLWFVFRGAELLVASAPAAIALPHCKHPKDLGMMLERTQYLGVLGREHCFSAQAAAGAAAPRDWTWQGLRALFGVLDDARFALAGRALQIVDWDRTHQFCGACGVATAARTSGRARECPGCGLVAYPRLAPAVMGLVRRERKLLLARSPRFPEAMYSALAGFVEPGETLEQCLEREVYEEVGIRVCKARFSPASLGRSRIRSLRSSPIIGVVKSASTERRSRTRSGLILKICRGCLPGSASPAG